MTDFFDSECTATVGRGRNEGRNAVSDVPIESFIADFEANTDG